MIELKATVTASLPIKSPGTFDSTSKPASANVKSFAALKMKAKLEKSNGSGLYTEQQSISNLNTFINDSQVLSSSQL